MFFGDTRSASGLSTHPDPAVAAGEAIGAVVEQIGTDPDLVTIFVSGSTIASLDDILDAAQALLSPHVLVGCSAAGVLGGSEEVETGTGLVVWAGRVPEDYDRSSLQPVRLEAPAEGAGGVASTILGMPSLSDDSALLLLADPFSFPADRFLEELASVAPGVPVIGGLASAGRAPGENRLVVNGTVHSSGAVGVVLPAELIQLTVSQGCRPIGKPWVVTKGHGNLIVELAGRPALQRVREMIDELEPEDRALAAQGFHAGFVANEQRERFHTGDFLIRGVMGADRETGAVAVGANVTVGQVVQFQVRDAISASGELRRLLPPEAEGALVFTCNGRGSHLFAEPSHDAAMIEELARGGVAGMFCAGELGPVGTANTLHGFTASVLWWR